MAYDRITWYRAESRKPKGEIDMQDSAQSIQTSLLKGFKIIDCSQFIPGPYATLICADLGADVVKVEPPAGDPMRYAGSMDSDGLSGAYKLLNKNKTVVKIDLKSTAGVDQFRQLIAASDVLLESYRPGVFAKLGFSTEDLQKVNSGLVHVALTGYGQTGAYRERAGHDLNYVSVAGLLDTTGTPSVPIMPMPPASDFGGGMQAALSILAGLLYRNRTGVGLSFDVSMSEAILAWQTLYLTESARTGGGVKRGESVLNGGAAWYQIYPTADHRFLTIAAMETKFWANFCQAVSKPEWRLRQSDPLPQKELIKEVGALFAARSLADWTQLLTDVDCCFEPLHELNDLPNLSHLKERQIIKQFGAGKTASIEVLFPAWINGKPPEQRRPVRFATLADVFEGWSAKS
jgi:crotonobetainyl-CoA:carnitine CoA-transferase CaiB-like acyl-CoA transferase